MEDKTWGNSMTRTLTHLFGTHLFGAQLLGAGCFLAVTTPAAAELRFCNDTNFNASIAIGYLAGDKWTSEGWWGAAPGQCVTAVDDPQPQAFYYWHAVNENGEFASDAYFFCAVNDVFTIIGDQDCEARGHNRTAFTEVQIGADGNGEVRLTQALAPKPAAVRKTAEPEAVAELVTEPAPEPTPKPAEAEGGSTSSYAELPQPSFKLTTDIATADLLTSAPLDFPAVKAAIQGEWTRDDGSQSSVIGAKRFEDFEDGTAKAAGSWRLTAACPGNGGDGPGIIIRYDENPDESLCLVLQDLADDSFTLRVAGSDQTFTYTR